MSKETEHMPQNRRRAGAAVPNSEATRSKPGQSGNPGGRPKTAPLSHACRELLASVLPDDAEGRTFAEAIAETLGQKALAGDIRAAQEIADRAEGKPRQSLEIENAMLREAFDRMTNTPAIAQWSRKRVVPRVVALRRIGLRFTWPTFSDYGEIWVVADLFGLPEVAAVVSDYVRQECAQGHFEPPKRSLGSGQVEAVGFLNKLG